MSCGLNKLWRNIQERHTRFKSKLFFSLNSSEPETQIMDYKTQQYKLLPGLAMAYATKFTFDHVWRLFQETQKKIAAGDLSMLPEVQ